MRMSIHARTGGRAARTSVTTTCILVLAAASALAGELLAREGDRIAIVGDSIPEQKLYSRYMELYLTACVHPGPNGHLVMAYAILRAMGFDGNIATITLDMKGEPGVSDGHKITDSDQGTVTIKSTRYPFCSSGNTTSPNGTQSILPFIDFNRELNRFTLIVKNITADQADVTWGETTRTFTRKQLEEGVNLVAEFPVNPFSASFREIDKAVLAKQNFETVMVKQVITRFRTIENVLPGDEEVDDILEQLRARLLAKHAGADVDKAFKPVEHTISVVPKP